MTLADRRRKRTKARRKLAAWTARQPRFTFRRLCYVVQHADVIRWSVISDMASWAAPPPTSSAVPLLADTQQRADPP